MAFPRPTHLVRLMLALLVCSLAPLAPVLAQESVQEIFLEIPGILGEAPPSAGEFQGFIAVEEFHHLVDLDERDGKYLRQVIFTKKLDRATVNLWNALQNGTQLGDVRFVFTRYNGFDGRLSTFEMKFQGAKVAAIEPYMPLDEAGTEHYERVRFTYNGIIIKKLLDPDANETATVTR